MKLLTLDNVAGAVALLFLLTFLATLGGIAAAHYIETHQAPLALGKEDK